MLQPVSPVQHTTPRQPFYPVIRLLIVEDDPDDVYLIKQMLHNDNRKQFDINHCNNIALCLQQIEAWTPDLILLDLGLGDTQGLETLEKLKAFNHTTPVIVLTGNNDEQLGEKAIKYGAEDFLPKADVTRILLSRAVRYAIERHRMRYELEQKAYQDMLTGLLNRSALYDKLEFLARQCERNHANFAVALLDLDGFKTINDQLGHHAGDQVLTTIGQRLQKNLRASDLAARYGGDEFVLLFTNYHCQQDLLQVLQRKQQLLNRPITLTLEGETKLAHVGTSIGLVEWKPGLSASALLKCADQAMYASKRKGKNCITVYQDTLPPTRSDDFII